LSGSGPLGILGGTFDPIHLGHLRLALELTELLGLAETKLIPAGIPSHRGHPRVAAQHRLAMTRLAVAGNSRLSVDDREIRQGTPSYTVDTLGALRVEFGNDRPLYLLIGTDAFVALERSQLISAS